MILPMELNFHKRLFLETCTMQPITICHKTLWKEMDTTKLAPFELRDAIKQRIFNITYQQSNEKITIHPVGV